MLIRITRNAEGIEDYFETGHKKGRELSRDELDRRVHLAGDINAFSKAVAYTQQHKHWQNNYYHLTASFAYEDNGLNDDTLRHIAQDMLAYYFCDYLLDDLIVACEAHRPVMQRESNKSTGEVNQRLLHMHLAVSMLDVKTGNQLRMIPYKHAADQAFQSLMAERYHLVDPAKRKRDTGITKKAIIARWNNSPDTLHKQTKVADLRKLFSTLLNGVGSLEAAIELLSGLDVVARVEHLKQKSGNRYLQVKTSLGTKNINLRGKGFEALEQLYYTPAELIQRTQQGKYKPATQPSSETVIGQHQAWWLGEQAKRKSKKIDYTLIEQKYQRKFNDRSKAARIYYVLYQNNIREELVKGYQIWEKHNARYLFNDSAGIKIYDHPNKISAQIPDDPHLRHETITLMLQMAISKGWDLETLNINGNSGFKAVVSQQVQAFLNNPHKPAVDVGLEVSQPEPQYKPAPRLSAVSQAVYRQQQVEAIKRLSGEEIEAIKTTLDAQVVVDYAAAHYGLITAHYQVIGNKIQDDRIQAKPKNVIDFLTKQCNVPFSEALPLLNGLLKGQQALEQEDPGMGFW